MPLLEAVSVYNKTFDIGTQMVLGETNNSGFMLTNIEGIGPGDATINVVDLAGAPGGVYNSTNIGTREITMTMVLQAGQETNQIAYKNEKSAYSAAIKYADTMATIPPGSDSLDGYLRVRDISDSGIRTMLQNKQWTKDPLNTGTFKSTYDYIFNDEGTEANMEVLRKLMKYNSNLTPSVAQDHKYYAAFTNDGVNSTVYEGYMKYYSGFQDVGTLIPDAYAGTSDNIYCYMYPGMSDVLYPMVDFGSPRSGYLTWGGMLSFRDSAWPSGGISAAVQIMPYKDDPLYQRYAYKGGSMNSATLAALRNCIPGLLQDQGSLADNIAMVEDLLSVNKWTDGDTIYCAIGSGTPYTVPDWYKSYLGYGMSSYTMYSTCAWNEDASGTYWPSPETGSVLHFYKVHYTVSASTGVIVDDLEDLGLTSNMFRMYWSEGPITPTMSIGARTTYSAYATDEYELIVNFTDVTTRVTPYRDIHDARHKAYKIFPLGKPVDLYFYTKHHHFPEIGSRVNHPELYGSGGGLGITGYVSSIDPIIFTDLEYMTVKITCPDPYFRGDTSTQSLANQSVTNHGRLTVYSNGDAPPAVDITITVTANGTGWGNGTMNIWCYPADNNDDYGGWITIDFSKLYVTTRKISSLKVGDRIVVTTAAGAQSLKVYRSNGSWDEEYNIMGCITAIGGWPSAAANLSGNDVWATPCGTLSKWNYNEGWTIKANITDRSTGV